MTRLATLLISFANLSVAQSAADLVENGRYSRAWAVVEQRVKSTPKDAHAQYLFGKLKNVAGDPEGAIKHLEEATSLDPDNAEYHALLGQLYGRHAQRASVLKRFGLAKKCKLEIERAVKLDPAHLEANFTLMMFLDRAPGMIGGDKDRAKTIPDQVAKLDPAKGWLIRAHFATETNQIQKAEEYYRKAIEADSKNFQARQRLAGTLINGKPRKLEEAEKHAAAAKQLRPAHVTPRSQLAVIYAFREQYTEMEAELNEAEKAIPEDLTPYWGAARVLLESGKELSRVETYMKKYLAQRPELGAPTHAHAHWTLGQLYEKLGRKSEAIEQLQKSVALKRDFEPAQKDLRRLRG